MKTLKKRIFILMTRFLSENLRVVYAVTIFLSASPIYAGEPFVFSYSENFPPFSWTENKQNLGIINDVVNEALVKRLKLKVRYQAAPWVRAQRMVQNGTADAFITVVSEKRKTYTIANSEPIISISLSFFVVKDFQKVDQLRHAQSFEELKEFRFVSNHGNGLWEEKLKGMNVEWLNDRFKIPFFILAGRGDIWPELSHVGRYVIKRADAKAAVVEIPIKIPIPTHNFFLQIGKKSAYLNIIPRFDETIREMKKEGVTQKIEERYY
jgi:polar amino acid transport system substrate-binding protein